MGGFKVPASPVSFSQTCFKWRNNHGFKWMELVFSAPADHWIFMANLTWTSREFSSLFFGEKRSLLNCALFSMKYWLFNDGIRIFHGLFHNPHINWVVLHHPQQIPKLPRLFVSTDTVLVAEKPRALQVSPTAAPHLGRPHDFLRHPGCKDGPSRREGGKGKAETKYGGGVNLSFQSPIDLGLLV